MEWKTIPVSWSINLSTCVPRHLRLQREAKYTPGFWWLRGSVEFYYSSSTSLSLSLSSKRTDASEHYSSNTNRKLTEYSNPRGWWLQPTAPQLQLITSFAQTLSRKQFSLSRATDVDVNNRELQCLLWKYYQLLQNQLFNKFEIKPTSKTFKSDHLDKNH